ncbi:TetR/AcrR family transcriptional regulator [Pseudonocardia sp. C8]|uniref:TetR/AcrR family transcriptional regulator n=1 Tax=Pseudonocardia sp. C8 TaxID=2762759 RepID=UPI001642B190|nr:TetR/AcrR family transcriptional regulator [Pseudonocardia sp. C8]
MVAPAAEPVPEPKTHRGRRTRELIVRSARKVFEEKGFLDTRIADIAAAAEMSHGTFYTYFQTKDEVFREIIADVAEGQFEATKVPEDFSADPAERIAYTIREYLRTYQKTARLSGVIQQVAVLDEDFRRARLEVRRAFRDRIERGIRRMQSEGIADETLVPKVAAEAITSMLSNFAYTTLTLGEPYDEDEAVATLTRMWTNGIGLRSRG